MLKFLFILLILFFGFLYIAPTLLKIFASRIVGKMTQQAYNNQSRGNQQSSYSSTSDRAEEVEEYHGSVLVHDEDSARRMKRMKADAEDVEAVEIDESIKVEEKEKAYR